jgi:hypothetical protein
MTTTKQIAEKLIELANKATHGVWRLTEKEIDVGYTQQLLTLVYGVDGPHVHVSYQGSSDAKADAEYIAALDPGTVTRLCRRLIKLEEALMSLNGNCSRNGCTGDPCIFCTAIEALQEESDHG